MEHCVTPDPSSCLLIGSASVQIAAICLILHNWSAFFIVLFYCSIPSFFLSFFPLQEKKSHSLLTSCLSALQIKKEPLYFQTGDLHIFNEGLMGRYIGASCRFPLKCVVIRTLMIICHSFPKHFQSLVILPVRSYILIMTLCEWLCILDILIFLISPEQCGHIFVGWPGTKHLKGSSDKKAIGYFLGILLKIRLVANTFMILKCWIQWDNLNILPPLLCFLKLICNIQK